MVGRTLGSKLIELGHEVRMGSREAGKDAAVEWVRGGGERASEGTFGDAAEFGELLINATAGGASLEALRSAGPENLAGKVLVDVANALDVSGGTPPTLSVCNDDSLAERIQEAFPDARVVKALNTVNARVMVEPGALQESTHVFVCGNDSAAKAQVIELLESFGWLSGDILDLGDITAARAPEMYLPLWLRLMGALGTPQFNIRAVRGE
jgi:8-hydroxy-5-deazaflavin:NADPH oxidoreductase